MMDVPVAVGVMIIVIVYSLVWHIFSSRDRTLAAGRAFVAFLRNIVYGFAVTFGGGLAIYTLIKVLP